ncbi:hypothetical protein [Haloarchaeobius sp. TZWWS8]|uniref:hypothetical protein n=1 Tax=Haloarchaeobius sp. TZWWS8 TaxID=3446121 RepID=UPI003EBF88D4
MDPESRTAEDAVLAGVTLAILVAIGFAVDVDVWTPLLLAAVVGAMLLELLLSVRAETVQTLWNRPRVRPAAVGVTVVVALVGAFVSPAFVFSVLWGGLVGYLLLAVLVVGGYLPPTSEWFGR